MTSDERLCWAEKVAEEYEAARLGPTPGVDHEACGVGPTGTLNSATLCYCDGCRIEFVLFVSRAAEAAPGTK